MRILPPLANDVELDIRRDDINRLLLESHKKCSTAAEEVMVLKELAKINGHYEKKPSTQINVLHIEQTVKRIESMSDEQLLELANTEEMFSLPSPTSDVIDVTPTVVREESDVEV